MPTAFEMVVVGSGGGPDETNLSAYLVKPADADWSDGVIALEAGSGRGALAQILKYNPGLFSSDTADSSDDTHYSAASIYSFVRCFIITHAHLDHINSLIISAGSLSGPRKRIFAAKPVLHDLETVFADRIWPNLASWDEGDEDYKLLYTPFANDEAYHIVSSGISVRIMPLSHGHNDTSGVYDSAALFLRHDASKREFLFFGDVEPDSIAAKPRTINVWRAAAPKIPATLSTIFIECSWPAGRPDNLLYGHLNPKHLADELTALAAEVVTARKIGSKESRERTRPLRKRSKANPISPEALHGALDGLRVFIVHCKDGNTDQDRPINHIITEQVRALVETKGLGAEILSADQGMHIDI